FIFSTFTKVATTVFVISGVVLAGSVGLLIVGIFTLVRTVAERRAFSDRMDDISRVLESRDAPPSSSPYGPDEAPARPPPPPPPPQAAASSPAATLVLLTF